MTQAPPADAQDWVTIWQSEMAALAVDRECHERVAAFASAWQEAVCDGPPGRPGADVPARPASAWPAFGLDGELERLWQGIAGLQHGA